MLHAHTVLNMSQLYENALAVQIIFLTLQKTFKIIENKSRARREIYSKLTIKTTE